MALLRRRHVNAIQASASPIRIGSYVDMSAQILTKQDFQKKAWDYYNLVGELHYAARYIGNSVSKIRLVAAETADDEKGQPSPTKNRRVTKAIQDLKSSRGGQEGLMRNLAMNLFMAGEAYLLGYEHPTTGLPQWEALSTDEIDITTGGEIWRRRTPGTMHSSPLSTDDFLQRLWVPHPRWSDLADSPMRAALDHCELLLLYSRTEAAAARSRLAGSGILFIPQEILGFQTGSARIEDHPMYQSLVQSMIEPIRDEGHPNAVVPIVLWGPAEAGDKIRKIDIAPNTRTSTNVAQQYEAVVRRLASALDLPSEILLGTSDANHWSAWSITEQAFSAHLEPLITLICDCLTLGYLRPVLERMGVANPEKYVIWYDPTDLVAPADETQRLSTLHDRMIISDEYLGDRMGVPTYGRLDPTSDEYKRRVGVKMNDPKMATTGEITEPPAPAGAAAVKPTQPVGPPEKLSTEKLQPSGASTKSPPKEEVKPLPVKASGDPDPKD